jgi:hypothetical protein
MIFNLKYKKQGISIEDFLKYLGTYLDQTCRRNDWECWITTQNMSRLAGVTWGGASAVLTIACKTCVRPILDCGGQLLAAASDMCARRDKVQDKALRLTGGAAKCTAIASLEIQTKFEPLNIRRGKRTITLAEKCTRLPVNHWKTTKCLHID